MGNQKVEQTIEEIYGACDEEFGAEHRDEAIKRADEMVANFEVDRPKTPVQGAQLMRKVYAEVTAKHQPKDEPKPRTAPVELTPANVARAREHKPGTLDDVAADMGRKMKAGTWRGGLFAKTP